MLLFFQFKFTYINQLLIILISYCLIWTIIKQFNKHQQCKLSHKTELHPAELQLNSLELLIHLIGIIVIESIIANIYC